MAKCKGCGKEIIWAKRRASGKTIPLDPSLPIYAFENGECWEPDLPLAVSHFKTCPNANDFSASRKKETDWKKILKAYILHVLAEESITYLSDFFTYSGNDPKYTRLCLVGLTREETAELMAATIEMGRDGRPVDRRDIDRDEWMAKKLQEWEDADESPKKGEADGTEGNEV